MARFLTEVAQFVQFFADVKNEDSGDSDEDHTDDTDLETRRQKKQINMRKVGVEFLEASGSLSESYLRLLQSVADTEVVSSLLERNDVDKEELLQFAEEKREQIPHLLRYYKQRAGCDSDEIDKEDSVLEITDEAQITDQRNEHQCASTSGPHQYERMSREKTKRKLDVRSPHEVLDEQTTDRGILVYQREEYKRPLPTTQQKGESTSFEGLQRYHGEDVRSKKERQDNLQKLCSDCSLAVAKATLKLPEVIAILGKAGKDFPSLLCDDIVTQYGRDEISNAKNDGQALGIIRRELNNSLYPEMLNEILRVLDTVGKSLHATRIRTQYQKQLRRHQKCKKCKAND